MCSGCLEPHPGFDTLELPCKRPEELTNHAYCRDCLAGHFDSSITDPSSFPPRCCTRIIPLFNCLPFLPNELVERFVERREELDTPDRTYCSNPECSKWVKPQNIAAGIATCSVCSSTTCTTCKGKQHDGLCPEDQAVKELMGVAESKRWKTCPECRNMVELELGCNHITCRCRHEFCYICTAKWRTCECPIWDERNIMDDPPRGAAPAPAPAPAPAQPAAGPPAEAAPAPGRNHQRNQRRRERQRERRANGHTHDFHRYYRSNGWNTACDFCDREDRWVNVCEDPGCRTSACWYCTRHRAWCPQV
ncbi:hypothetical protein CC80DRAFT_324070 [Byssothecium circinans]|uniref:RBR-type E3 ubiquitin transferase n=1 Tax=Byssothecium circinans TaxID=147558 RepID=A0A6A5U8S4_9PLEO|nr:hypothetical protein CC80DRAFT_324070 [Byssothecium circinans]